MPTPRSVAKRIYAVKMCVHLPWHLHITLFHELVQIIVNKFDENKRIRKIIKKKKLIFDKLIKKPNENLGKLKFRILNQKVKL